MTYLRRTSWLSIQKNLNWNYLRPYTDINFCWTAKIISKNFKENVGKYSCHMTGQGFSRQSIKCANYKRKNGHIKP